MKGAQEFSISEGFRLRLRFVRFMPLLFSLSICIAPLPLSAHDVRWEAARQKPAVVLSIRYGEGTPFSYERYDIFPPGGDTPFQTGRTDALGRIAFLPDRAGEWKVRFHSDDGHGGEARIQVGGDQTSAVKKESLFNRFGPSLTGVSFLFGLFGLFMLFLRRRE